MPASQFQSMVAAEAGPGLDLIMEAFAGKEPKQGDRVDVGHLRDFVDSYLPMPRLCGALHLWGAHDACFERLLCIVHTVLVVGCSFALTLTCRLSDVEAAVFLFSVAFLSLLSPLFFCTRRRQPLVAMSVFLLLSLLLAAFPVMVLKARAALSEGIVAMMGGFEVTSRGPFSPEEMAAFALVPSLYALFLLAGLWELAIHRSVVARGLHTGTHSRTHAHKNTRWRIKHKPTTNQPQTNHKPTTTQPQTNHKPTTNQLQTNHKPTTNQPQPRAAPGRFGSRRPPHGRARRPPSA